MGTHLLLLGPLLSSSGTLAALLLDSHYKGPVLARSLASRRSWEQWKPASSISAGIIPPKLPIPFLSLEITEVCGSTREPGKGGGDPEFEDPRVTVGHCGVGTGDKVRWSWSWEEDEIVRKAIGCLGNSMGSTEIPEE